jgi:hypothetical protein
LDEKMPAGDRENVRSTLEGRSLLLAEHEDVQGQENPEQNHCGTVLVRRERPRADYALRDILFPAMDENHAEG